jgi:hypothetical protein
VEVIRRASPGSPPCSSKMPELAIEKPESHERYEPPTECLQAGFGECRLEASRLQWSAEYCDQCDRRQSLDERCQKRQKHTAPRRSSVCEHIGRDDRLAMPWARRMKDKLNAARNKAAIQGSADFRALTASSSL